MDGMVRLLLAVSLVCALSARVGHAAEIAAFLSAGRTLHGLLYRPLGAGPFPAVLYNHGGDAASVNESEFETIGSRFVLHGWVFFAPHRAGQGLSRDAGEPIGSEIASAREQGGASAADARLIEILTTEQVFDERAAHRDAKIHIYPAYPSPAVDCGPTSTLSSSSQRSSRISANCRG